MWVAESVSLLGNQFAQVAIAIVVYQRTHSAFLTALAYALTYLPPVAGGPVLSALADRFSRRAVMIASDVLRAALVVIMAVPSVPFWALALLVTVTTLAGVPFTAARTALLPDVLPGEMLAAGTAIGGATSQLSQVVGFAVGAVVVSAAGPYRTLLLDAASFAFSVALVAGWVRRRPAASDPSGSRSVWSQARLGVRLVAGDPVSRMLVSFGLLAGIYMVPEALAAPYAQALGRGPMAVGLLMAAMPMGTIAGALGVARLVKPARRLAALGWLAMLATAPLIASAARPSLAVVLALWVVSGIGSGYQVIASAAFVRRLPDHGRGAGIGAASSGLLAAQGFGFLAGGAAASVLGPQDVVAIAGVAGLALAVLLAIAWARLPVRVAVPSGS